MREEQRRSVLADIFALKGLVGGPGKGVATPEQKARLAELTESYRALVPIVGMSRCPFSDAMVHHSFDPYGLDGLWWDHDAPVRPAESLPPSFFALTGAVAPRAPFELAPFVAHPGAAAPYVVPRLLANANVQAVVSGLPVGRHLAFAIVYFARSAPSGLEPVDDWGADFYELRDASGATRRGSRALKMADIDFDLAPWLARGKLHWIAPGDASGALSTDVQNCPYLKLNPGPGLYRVQNGTFAPLEAPAEIVEEMPRIASGAPPDPFGEAEEKYHVLRRDFDEGRIDATQFEAALNALTVLHEERYWAIGANTGLWNVYDGSDWQRADPPRAPGTREHQKSPERVPVHARQEPTAQQPAAATPERAQESVLQHPAAATPRPPANPGRAAILKRVGLAAMVAIPLLAAVAIFLLDLDPVGLLYDVGLYSRWAMQERMQAALTRNFDAWHVHINDLNILVTSYSGNGCYGHFETNRGPIDVDYRTGTITEAPSNADDTVGYAYLTVTRSAMSIPNNVLSTFQFITSYQNAEMSRDLGYLGSACRDF